MGLRRAWRRQRQKEEAVQLEVCGFEDVGRLTIVAARTIEGLRTGSWSYKTMWTLRGKVF